MNPVIDDPTASTFVYAHRDRLVSYARRRGLSNDEALDAVQDSFVSFLALPVADTIATDRLAALKYLTAILRHHLQNQRRKVMRRGIAQAGLAAVSKRANVETAEELSARAEELQRAHGCIVAMAKMQRDVIALSVFAGRTHEQVAAQLGISEAYVRVLLHRAREAVRTCPPTWSAPAP